MTSIRRNIKNVVHNYSDAKVKVREATSNDPWGPSSTLMSEIAEMTYNVMAYTEIMSMIWKRLNDKNKNWRHVYKALVLLDYLVKTGSEKVAQQCKENLFVVQSLRDFQFTEEAKDHGLSVREKAKQLVALLKDDEKLRAERASALRTRERLGGVGVGGGGGGGGGASSIYRRSGSADFTASAGGGSRPTSFGGGAGVRGGGAGVRGGGGGGGANAEAEDVELEVALAISKEEHAEEMKRRQAEGLKDDMKLRMALEASKQEEESGGGLVDLIDTSLSAAPANALDPWQSPPVASSSSSSTVGAAWSDPWATQRQQQQQHPVGNGTRGAGGDATSVSTGSSDPWSSSGGGGGFNVTDGQQRSASDLGDIGFGAGMSSGADPWSSGFGDSSTTATAAAASFTSEAAGSGGGEPQPPRAKSAQGFLGDHGGLVNLDSLVSKPKAQPKPPFSVFGNTNPFAPVSAQGPGHPSNPFHSSQPAQPTLSELQRRAQGGFLTDTTSSSGSGLVPPLIQAPATAVSSAAAAAVYPPSYNPWGPSQQPQPQQQYQQNAAASLNPFM